MSVTDWTLRNLGPGQQLAETWREPTGFAGWFRQVHHTNTGKKFLFTSFCFFLVGGILATLMRIQLAKPLNGFLGPDRYNQIFTTHGSTMIWLFAIPMMFEGLGVYLIPLMVGTRNIAFPRLAAFAYYLYLLAGLLFYAGFLSNIGPDAAWFSYVTLSTPQYAPGHRLDYWCMMVILADISYLCVAICLLGTILRLRAPGMSLNRMPIFAWTQLVVSFIILFAVPAVLCSTLLLYADRILGTQFFNPAEGGDVLLYQHLFWFWGHPIVYVIFLPGISIVSDLVSVFSRRHLFGYTAIVLSTIAIGFLGFSVWVHHMFATGISLLGRNFYTAASLMIAIPTAVEFFCWLATMWHGKVNFKVPMLFIMGFFVVFLIGGFSGIMMASVPIDLAVHDTYFVVGHLHYVLIGAAVFPLFAALYYWLPKITGHMLDEAMGKVHFWLFFIGFNVTFFTFHILGLKGMPREVYTYIPELHWGAMNMLATWGVAGMFTGVLVFIFNYLLANLSWRRAAGKDPWGGGTLEWSLSSPPPDFNFLELPTVNGKQAVWDAAPDQPVVKGVREDVREVLVTDAVDALPDHKALSPGPSIWPAWTALAVAGLFYLPMYNLWFIIFGGIATLVTLVMWYYPRPPLLEAARQQERWAA